METGILNISAAEHHAIPALSYSGMKQLAVSPLRYWHTYLNPERKDDEEETKALRIGSALHCAVLESEATFDSRYVQKFDPSQWEKSLDTIADLREWITFTGNKPKGTRKADLIEQAQTIMRVDGRHVPILDVEESAFYARHAGKTILKPDEWNQICGMSRALRSEPVIGQILSEGKPEVSMVARDPETGVLLKIRMDWFSKKCTADLKSFTQKRGASIDKSIGDAIVYEGYYLQAYFYDYVRSLVTGEKPGSFDSVWAFVESEQPHETRIKAFRRMSLGQPNIYWMQAKSLVWAMIRQYADCQKKFGDRPWRDEQSVDPLIDEDVKQLAY